MALAILAAVVLAGAAIAKGIEEGEGPSLREGTAPVARAPSVPSKPPAPARPEIPIDVTSVHHSLTVAFQRRFRDTHGYATKVSDDAIGAGCEKKENGAFQCGIGAKLLLGISDIWGYRVELTDDRCWTAEALEEFGAYQSQVDAYRNREFLAPGKRDVRRMVRQARRLHTLEGCIEARPPGDLGGTDDAARFIANLAALNVQRHFPGDQKKTRCRSLGREQAALVPDSWNYDCEVTLANGRKYVDRIHCFDEPPHENYDPCGSDNGYPRIPPRPLP